MAWSKANDLKGPEPQRSVPALLGCSVFGDCNGCVNRYVQFVSELFCNKETAQLSR